MTATVLCVLDGFGLNPNARGNAVTLARKPHFDRIWETFPRTTLCTHGERVGLPDGQMGNSEVGHLNIGAGRVVEQWLLRITRGLKGTAVTNSGPYKDFVSSVEPGAPIHLIGLFSDGGVHSSDEHLFLLINRLLVETKAELLIHVISDGRDTGPQSLIAAAPKLVELCKQQPRVKIATLCGRFYAMDRDKRWERTKLAYDAFVHASAPSQDDLIKAIQTSYERGVFDEFIEPVTFLRRPLGKSDRVVFWNFRADRMRQIVQAFTDPQFTGFERGREVVGKSQVLCFSQYSKAFDLPFLFALDTVTNPIGEVVAQAGLKQLRVAETEKYPHVTYFLNGGIETCFPGEDRKMAPSPRDVKTYDLKPEMSAAEVCGYVVESIEADAHPFIVVNFANCDMVGHTGVVEAAVRAVETVDLCLGKILSALEKKGGRILVLADHGNAEQMINYEDGTPHTAHTKYPVPCVLVDFAAGAAKVHLRDGGALCDVAPTLLKMMNLAQPKEMSGSALY